MRGSATLRTASPRSKPNTGQSRSATIMEYDPNVSTVCSTTRASPLPMPAATAALTCESK